MSAGFSTARVPKLVLEGISSAFKQWEDMSGGEWLQTAPEYLVTVNVAEVLRKSIPATQRTIWLEHGVANALKQAGGKQPGRKAELLRIDGRIDIVLAHANQKPRTVIEIKCPIWQPNNAGRGGTRADLHRICRTLLHGKDQTQLYSGVLGIFTSSAPPLRGSDGTAKARLQRKWGEEWQKTLRTWEWAERHGARYRRHLNINVTTKVREVDVGGEKHAWAAVAVVIFRRTRPRSD